jgi:hypothetical protein
MASAAFGVIIFNAALAFNDTFLGVILSEMTLVLALEACDKLRAIDINDVVLIS